MLHEIDAVCCIGRPRDRTPIKWSPNLVRNRALGRVQIDFEWFAQLIQIPRRQIPPFHLTSGENEPEGIAHHFASFTISSTICT
jgi:hypothetical protein